MAFVRSVAVVAVAVAAAVVGEGRHSVTCIAVKGRVLGQTARA